MHSVSSPSTKLLSFLVPGFLHNLGNSILIIQGRAQLLSSDDVDLAATQGQLLASCDCSRTGMAILRALVDDADGEQTALGPLLVELFDMMQDSFRDAGIAIDVGPDLADAGHRVPLGVVARAVGGVGFAIRDALPAGLRGKLSVRWISPPLLEFRLRPDRTNLPFQIDMAAIAAAVAHPGIAEARSNTEGDALQLRLRVEAAAGADS